MQDYLSTDLLRNGVNINNWTIWVIIPEIRLSDEVQLLISLSPDVEELSFASNFKQEFWTTHLNVERPLAAISSTKGYCSDPKEAIISRIWCDHQLSVCDIDAIGWDQFNFYCMFRFWLRNLICEWCANLSILRNWLLFIWGCCCRTKWIRCRSKNRTIVVVVVIVVEVIPYQLKLFDIAFWPTRDELSSIQIWDYWNRCGSFCSDDCGEWSCRSRNNLWAT